MYPLHGFVPLCGSRHAIGIELSNFAPQAISHANFDFLSGHLFYVVAMFAQESQTYDGCENIAVWWVILEQAGGIPERVPGG